MFINWKLRELNLKIVYYGPALSGKTTNLQIIHRQTNPKLRGDLVSLKTREDRTIFFDFLQLEFGNADVAIVIECPCSYLYLHETKSI